MYTNMNLISGCAGFGVVCQCIVSVCPCCRLLGDLVLTLRVERGGPGLTAGACGEPLCSQEHS